jgi:DNA polymerase III delta prime subunit
MEHQLFIHKFQPLFLKDFEMDNTMFDLLNTFITMDNLNILFIGDMGCGKSTLLNAMIREYYHSSTDYNENILYINNLKEQGINFYRNDVKTFCQTFSSINNKKKIVILDDIDFINEQSQQVFRNCIDKYEKNVHFIASCTNSQKVIESLQSRFFIVKIKPLERKHLEKIMEKIAINEKINMEYEAKKFILDICNNNAKILINYMEKFKLLNHTITLDLAKKVCTNISFCEFELYTNFLKECKLKESIHILYSIYDKGYSVMDILDNYFLFVKTSCLLNENEKYNIIPIICKYITVFHNIHEDEIELALFTNNIIDIFNK